MRGLGHALPFWKVVPGSRAFTGTTTPTPEEREDRGYCVGFIAATGEVIGCLEDPCAKRRVADLER